eukprot:2906345-Amphidinium_carterae.1
METRQREQRLMWDCRYHCLLSSANLLLLVKMGLYKNNHASEIVASAYRVLVSNIVTSMMYIM